MLTVYAIHCFGQQHRMRMVIVMMLFLSCHQQSVRRHVKAVFQFFIAVPLLCMTFKVSYPEWGISRVEVPSLLVLKNSLITSLLSSFRAALHFFFPTSVPFFCSCWLADGLRIAKRHGHNIAITHVGSKRHTLTGWSEQ